MVFTWTLLISIFILIHYLSLDWTRLNKHKNHNWKGGGELQYVFVLTSALRGQAAALCGWPGERCTWPSARSVGYRSRSRGRSPCAAPWCASGTLGPSQMTARDTDAGSSWVWEGLWVGKNKLFFSHEWPRACSWTARWTLCSRWRGGKTKHFIL